MSEKLTDRQFWDQYWNRVTLPSEIRRSDGNLYINAILDVFDAFIPKNRRLSILEIGGAPGQYLAYFSKKYDCTVHCLDYSEAGCNKTDENFRLLKIEGAVHRADIFSKDLRLPGFDVIYSLGFIEHFSDLETAVRSHAKWLNPGGLLFLGVPNLSGVYRPMLQWTAPRFLARHNLAAMDAGRWKSFETALELRPVYRGYIGGFEFGILDKCEKKTPFHAAVKRITHVLFLVFRKHGRILRKANHRRISGYLMGVYRTE